MGNRKGQSVVEYAVLIAVVIAALLAMQIYFKRASQGKLREAADQLGDQFNPVQSDYNFTKNFNSSRTEGTLATGASNVQVANENQSVVNGLENTVTADLDAEALFFVGP